MFGLSFSEVIFCLIVALLVFGPKKLPEVARMLGKTLGELRRALDDVKYDFKAATSEVREDIATAKEKGRRLIAQENVASQEARPDIPASGGTAGTTVADPQSAPGQDTSQTENPIRKV